MPLKHLARLLTILALLLAPLGMLGGHAMAQTHGPEVQAASGHCAEMAGDRDRPSHEEDRGKDIDCRIACSCIPAAGSEPPVAAPVVGGPAIPASFDGVIGANPAADPPPPRLS